MKRTLYKSLGLLGALLSVSQLLKAQDTVPAEQMINGVSATSLTLTLLFTMLVLGIVILVLTATVYYMIREQKPAIATDAQGAPVVAVAPEKKLFTRKWWNKRLVDAVPITSEASVLLHHDYDGIRELDNNLPPWWKWGFYLTIGMAVVYLGVYHIGSDWSSEGEYLAEVEEATLLKDAYLDKMANLVNEKNVEVLADNSSISSGKAIYTTNCALCHGQAGEGQVGPNLTDPYWIHGGSINEVFATIKYGVEVKGMRAWEEMLKPREMQEVASYIMSLQGSNPPGAKAAEGDLYQAKGATATDSTALSMK